MDIILFMEHDAPDRRLEEDMRHKDTALMERILAFAERFYLEADRSPTTTEIAHAMGIARSSAYRYLVAMSERGMISYNGTSIVTSITKRKSPARPVALYDGAIPCGSPEIIDAAVEEIVLLPVSIFGAGELYVIRTSGNSMIGAGIEPEDLVVVQKRDHANIGDIVVALHENESTLKRLTFDDRTKRYILHPENPEMADIQVQSGELRIQGVARFVIKTL